MFSFFKSKDDPKKKLKSILKGYKLPSFPAVVMQILQKIRNPYSSTADVAEFLYKTTDYYAPDLERSIRWNEPEIGIEWPGEESPLLSRKDSEAPPFSESEFFQAE